MELHVIKQGLDRNIVKIYIPTYSKVSNKQTGCLLENEKIDPTYTYFFQLIR
jgi:hypothetical protein